MSEHSESPSPDRVANRILVLAVSLRLAQVSSRGTVPHKIAARDVAFHGHGINSNQANFYL